MLPHTQPLSDLTNYKMSNLTSSKLGGIQSILNKAAPNSNNNANKNQQNDKNQMSRSMNVQEILNQSIDPKRLKGNFINQS